MKKYILLSTSLFVVYSLAQARTSSFVFITPPQVVLPNAISKEITIEARNEDSKVENVLETFDLNFVSTSPTGKFLASSGKPISRTMNKSTAHRTFYYIDSREGNFLISVTLTGRGSRESFTITQPITIGQKIIPQAKKGLKTIAQTERTNVSLISSTSDVLSENVFTADHHQGFFEKISYWPVRFFGFIKRLFVEG